MEDHTWEAEVHLAVITESGLVRSGARVLASLKGTHKASLQTAEQAAALGLPGEATAFLYVGEVPEAKKLRAKSGTQWEAHGASWGFSGNEAWIFGTPVDDPKATLAAISADLGEIQEIAEIELLTGEDPKKYGGLHFAGRFLDPYLKVEAQTVVGGKHQFTPERMVWERQYTIGVVAFFNEGFDKFVESAR